MNNSIVDLVNNQRNNVSLANNPQIQQLKAAMSQVQSCPNPQAMLQNIISQNPNLSAIINMARGRGMSMEQLGRMLAQQRGVNYDELLDALRN